MRGLNVLIKKEVKELIRDPKILLGMILAPLIMFPAMGLLINVTMRTAIEKGMERITLTMMALDKGTYTDMLKKYLIDNGVELIEIPGKEIDIAINKSVEVGATALIVVPEEFSANIDLGKRANLRVYSILNSISLAESAKQSRVSALLEGFSKELSMMLIERGMPERDPEVVLRPLVSNYISVLRGKRIEAPPQLLFSLMTSQFMMPWLAFMVLISAANLSATSMAMEKEEKTLEVLMTLPVSRFTILLSKLAGPSIVALLASLSSIAGFKIYMDFMIFRAEIGDVSVKINIPTEPSTMYLLYTMIGITFFLSIMATLALALALSVFTQDVRSAQQLVGNVLVPLMIIPSIVLMFIEPEMLPLPVRVFIYALPFSYPTLILKHAIYQEVSMIILPGIVYLCLFTLIVLYFTAKLFSTERVITARITLFRRRSRRGVE